MPTSSPERWRQVEQVLDGALDVPSEQRDAFLDDACGDDADLRAIVNELLLACDAPRFFPDAEAVVFAAPLLDDSPPPDPAEGRRIGSYRLVRELGRGGMGTVFLAARDDGQFAQRVALKLMRRGITADDTLRQRFLDERQILARLEHPHIATLLDGGVTDDGQPYFVMQYVEGRPIHAYCDERQLTIDERVRLFLSVCDAVQHAHKQRIVHRDLKPGNILVSADGHAKLLDFGIAKLLVADDTTTDDVGLTRTGERLLTPEYASPEQVRGEPVTASTDVYSLGVLLYELLSGRRPYTVEAGTPHQLERAIIEQEPTRPSLAIARASVRDTRMSAAAISGARRSTPERLRRRLKGDLDVVVLMALRKEQNQRYATVDQMADDLRRHLAGQPVHARASLRLYRAAHLVRRHRSRLAAGVAVLAVLGATGLAMYLRNGATAGATAAAAPRLVVLPFRHLGDPASQYLTDGLTEEVTGRLAALAGLTVISRSSADQYRSTTLSPRDIGSQLGATYALDGSVRWETAADGSHRVRVTPSLLRVADEHGLWSQNLDAELANVFAVQAHIAERVAAALDVTLHGSDRQGLAAEPTTNLEAYDFYLRGNEYFNRSFTREDRINAVALYERAVAADPRYAHAWARLARSHLAMYWYTHDHSPDRLLLARSAVVEAFRLAPDLAETQIALAYYQYWGLRDFEHAHQRFSNVLLRQPGNADVLFGIAFLERRMGRWTDAMAHLRTALELDPRSGTGAQYLGATYFFVRDFAAAERAFDRAIALTPDWPVPYVYKANLYVAWHGDLPAAHRVLHDALTRLDAGRLAAALVAAERSSASVATTDSALARTIQALSLPAFPGDTVRYHLLKAELYWVRSEPHHMRAHADSARIVLEGRLRAPTDDPNLHTFLGLAYAMLGRRDDAVLAGERALELLPIAADANQAPFLLSHLARIHVLLGEPDAAIAYLESLLDSPSWITTHSLRSDPVWRPLRDHHRFRSLMNRTAAEQGPANQY